MTHGSEDSGARTINEELFLVDFENVPGVDLSQIGIECRVIVFTGVNQKSVPLELVTATQRLGERLEWRRVDASGRNALDFFIACELGRVQASGNGTSCTVLSNDKGFDPLLRHLNAAGVKCQRIGTQPIAKPIPTTKPKPTPMPKVVVDPANFNRVLEILGKSEKKSRPRKHKTLAQAISSLFQKKISKDQVEEIIAKMHKEGRISVNAGAITYAF
jgi:PIN domain